MIKRVPYSDNLIPIGNAPVYAGKPVYSDGRVAYGWNYVPQAVPPSAAPSMAGLFINKKRNSNLYKLVTSGLQTGRWIRGKNLSWDCYCLPVRFDEILQKKVFLNGNTYDYTGTVIAVDNTGRLVTHDGPLLRFYAADGTFASVSIGSVGSPYPCFNRFSGNYTKIAANLYSTTGAVNVFNNALEYNSRLWQVTDVNKARFFRSVAYCQIDTVFKADADNIMDVTLRHVSSVTLSSDDLTFRGQSAITVTSDDGILVHAGATGTGTVHVSFSYNGTTVSGDITVTFTDAASTVISGLYAIEETAVDVNGLRAEVYPQYYDLCQGARLRLFDNNVANNNGDIDLSLLLTTEQTQEQVITGNPTSFETGRVMACNNNNNIYIANNELKRLWLYTNGQYVGSRVFDGLDSCWSLVWLKKALR